MFEPYQFGKVSETYFIKLGKHIQQLYQNGKVFINNLPILGIYHFDKVQHNPDKELDGKPMKTEDIRRENARALSELIGGPAKLARKVGVTDSRMSQLIGPNFTRNIGTKMSRLLEEAFDKETGWLDQDHRYKKAADEKNHFAADREVLSLVYATLEELHLLTVWRETNDIGRAAILATLKNVPRDIERLTKLVKPAG